MNYKDYINYLAYIAEPDVETIKELELLYSKLIKEYSSIQLAIYSKYLIEKINEQVLKSEKDLETSMALGNSYLNYDFIFIGERYIRKLTAVVENWKLAIVFFQTKINLTNSEIPELDFNKLPDYIKPEMLTQLMGWTESTISTKHSKGELACVEGTRLTPKQGLMEYLEKKTKGLIQDTDKWFSKNIMKK